MHGVNRARFSDNTGKGNKKGGRKGKFKGKGFKGDASTRTTLACSRML